jgi:thioredoxin 1
MTQQMTKQDSLEKIFDYENSHEWNYKGSLPAVIDFYADWCAPCKMVAPIMEELSEEYNGQVNFYKVDTSSEAELSGAFGIRSIPSILFIPKSGKPLMAAGALPKNQMKDIIESELLGVVASAGIYSSGIEA